MKAIKILKDKTGEGGLIFIIAIYIMIVIFALVLEADRIYSTYYEVENALYGSLNCALEYAMMDEYRADKIIQFDAALAENKFFEYAAQDIAAVVTGNSMTRYKDEKEILTVVIDDITTTNDSISITGIIRIPTMLSSVFPAATLELPINLKNTNIRIDE